MKTIFNILNHPIPAWAVFLLICLAIWIGVSIGEAQEVEFGEEYPPKKQTDGEEEVLP